MAASFDNARFEWEEGAARLDAAPEPDRRELERVVDRTVAELRRRLGGPFTTDELVELYAAGTTWVLELAEATAPGNPRVWDQQTIAGAAFLRYVREAGDFAGGRRVTSRRPLPTPRRGG